MYWVPWVAGITGAQAGAWKGLEYLGAVEDGGAGPEEKSGGRIL